MTRDYDVNDRPQRGRYELTDGGELIAWADYSIDGDIVVIPHVETAVAHRGQGNAARLMDGVVDDLRATRRSIRPICSYAAGYLRERPETHDLLAG